MAEHSHELGVSTTERLNRVCDAGRVANTASLVHHANYVLGTIATTCLNMTAAEQAEWKERVGDISPVFNIMLTIAIRYCFQHAVPMTFIFVQQERWSIRIRESPNGHKFFIRGPSVPARC